MSGILLTSEIINNIWAMHPRAVSSYLPTVAKIIKGDKEDFETLRQIRKENEEQNAPQYAIRRSKTAAGFKVNRARDLNDVPEGSIAIISYSGVVRMKSGMSNKGTEETRRELELAGQNPNVKAVLFKGHSGGGSVFGTENLANDIKGFEAKYSKPIASIVEDQACSAMYWIVSAAPMVFGANKTCEVGCIGVMSTFMDYEEWMQKEGIKEIIVRASKSFNKNEEYYQAAMGNTEPLKRNVLDKMNNAFMSAVKTNRRGKINLNNKVTHEPTGEQVAEVLSGKTYYGNDAVAVGLIDKIGSTSDALKYLSREAKKYKTIKSNSKSTRKMETKNYTSLTDAALSSEIANLEASMPLSTEEGYEAHKMNLDLAKAVQAGRKATADNATLTTQLEAANEGNNTEELTEQVATLTTARDEANAKVTTHEATIADRDATIATQASQIETLTAEGVGADNNLIEANKKLEASNKKNAAYETFIEKEYGAEAVTAFVADANGDIAQPEAVDTKVVYKTAKEKTADTYRDAKAAIEAADKKKSDKKDDK